MVTYMMSKENSKHVMKLNGITNKGFADIVKGNARGMDRITEESLYQYYEVCSKEHFENRYFKKER